MKLVFYSIVLNHHQACVADEFYRLLGDGYRFVELTHCQDMKGASSDYSDRPYLVKAWETADRYAEAMDLARTADVCVFAGCEALPFEKERMRLGLLSFDMSERLLKRGWVNLASPRILKMISAYHLHGWSRKPLYKLSCSAFAAMDSCKLRTFEDKCYKWGYFTRVDTDLDIEASVQDVSISEITPLMWCSRFLILKHPELPILLAERLKRKGYKFVLDMYGSGEKLDDSKRLAREMAVEDVVRFIGSKPNDELMRDMRIHEIFLFTSDRNEGWGAVANEAMSNGCTLVASDAIGSAPYLIEDGRTGVLFRSSKTNRGFRGKTCRVDRNALDSLAEKVEWLLDHPRERADIARRGYESMRRIWSPRNAANSLLTLIDCLKKGENCTITEGPCSPA